MELSQKDILVLGDFPSEADILQGNGFKDKASRFMFWAIASANISWSNMKFIHFYNDESDFIDGNTEYNFKLLDEKLEIIKPKVIILLGENISKLLVDVDKIEKYRGSVMDWTRNGHKYWVIPTYDQRMLSDKRWSTIGNGTATRCCMFQNDFRKSVFISENDWKRPEEKFNLDPSIEEVEQFVDWAIESQVVLYGDIEGTGLNLQWSEAVVLGFAWNEEEAIVIPLKKFGGVNNYNPDGMIRVRLAIQKLFDHCNGIVWQNGPNYDIPVLNNKVNQFNLEHKAFHGDTMLLHHTINPELEHNIGFINSVYGKLVYWKDSFINKKESIFYTDQLEMKRYNARDCVALVPMYKAMLEECEDKGLLDLYQEQIDLTEIVVRMSAVGLHIDPKRLKDLQEYMKDELKEKEKTFRELSGVPDQLNLSSQDDLRRVWFGESSDKAKKVLPEAWKYEPWTQYGGSCPTCGCHKWFTQAESNEINNNPVLKNSFETKCRKCKVKKWHSVDREQEGKMKSKTTKEYLKIQNVLAVETYNPPYILTKFKGRLTDSGKRQIDVKFRETYTVALVKRLAEIEGLRAWDEPADSGRKQFFQEQHDNINKMLLIIKAFNEFASIKKLKESYSEWETDSDSRVHSSIKVTGTATGRFSSSKPNLFTFPSPQKLPALRQIFTPKEGNIFLSCDYKGLENYVMAYVTKDKGLLDIINNNKDLHDENTKALFGLSKEKEPKKFNLFRKAAKIFQFAGLAYGGGDKEIHGNILSKHPETKLTLKNYKIAKAAYMAEHAGYKAWVEHITDKANKERMIETYVSGRRRYLYGNENSIRKEAMNTPIQGTAADVVNRAMIRIHRRLRERNLKAELVLYVYDELNYEVPLEELPEVYKIVEEEMTRPVKIKGINRHFKIDPEIGYSLGDLHSFDTETFEILGDSKH